MSPLEYSAALIAYAYCDCKPGVIKVLPLCENKDKICALYWASRAGSVDAFCTILLRTYITETDLRFICQAGPPIITKQVFDMTERIQFV
jgi:hypothetical protein